MSKEALLRWIRLKKENAKNQQSCSAKSKVKTNAESSNHVAEGEKIA
jgi:hypothetical protein